MPVVNATLQPTVLGVIRDDWTSADPDWTATSPLTQTFALSDLQNNVVRIGDWVLNPSSWTSSHLTNITFETSAAIAGQLEWEQMGLTFTTTGHNGTSFGGISVVPLADGYRVDLTYTDGTTTTPLLSILARRVNKQQYYEYTLRVLPAATDSGDYATISSYIPSISQVIDTVVQTGIFTVFGQEEGFSSTDAATMNALVGETVFWRLADIFLNQDGAGSSSTSWTPAAITIIVFLAVVVGLLLATVRGLALARPKPA
jgi:hypothetical protein